MYKFTKHDEPDIDKYEDRLRTNGCICYDYELWRVCIFLLQHKRTH